MLGKLLSKILKDKNMTQSQLARETNINVGHLTHIEKGDRMPSHKALHKICNTLDIPYQQIMYTFDKLDINNDQTDFSIIEHIPYNDIPAFNTIDDLIHCPAKFGTSSFAIKIKDNSMEPKLLKGSYAYIEQNSDIMNNDIVLIKIGEIMTIRKLHIQKNVLVLKALNDEYPNINLSKNENYIIIGKVLGTNDDY